METEVTVPISSSSSSSPPHHHHHHHHDDFDPPSDFSPVGSPDLTASVIPPPSDQPPLSDDLRRKIIKQVEYYLSDENLATDKFLMKFITKDRGGFVPIGVIASFKKMKKLTRDTSMIVAALRESSLLVVSSNGKKVKRLQPFSFTEVRDPQLCTVSVENLPEDHSEENLRRIFGEVGNVKNISISDPHIVKEPRKCTVAEKLLSGKLHALVEYDSVEAAEKAADTLNDGHDWRFGLRVKLLKKMTKGEKKKLVWRELDPEKNSSVQTSDPAVDDQNHLTSDHQEDSHDEEDGLQLPKEKNGDHAPVEKNEKHAPDEKCGHRAQNRGRGRRQKNRGTSGHGHGTVSSNHRFEPAKPPPGPKMPDGTKGFTLGRGRPLVAAQS